MVTDAFPAEQQARALGIWTAVSSLALALGPLVGGLLVDVDWRLIFWINVPILAAGLVVVLAVVPETRDRTATHRLDLAGLLILAAGLTAIVLPLVESDAWGLGSAKTVVLLLVGGALMFAFWAVEHRVEQPIVDFALFRNGPYFGASAAAFALVGAYWSLMFFQPQYLQGPLGHSATATGLLILPITVPMMVISPLAGRMIARFGARSLMTAGMLCGLAGLIFMTRISDGSGYGLLLPGYLLFGISLGLVYAPMSSAAMAAMPPEKTGIASGVLAMNRVLAGAVALAVTGAVFQSLREAHGFPTALARSSWVLVALVGVGTLLTWVFVRSAPTTSSDDEAVDPSPPRHPHHLHRPRFHF
jgi:MFS family permease